MIRPLDRFGSIKVKLGVLVAVSVAVAATLSAVGLRLGLWPRYTVPAAVVLALVVTQLLARGMTSPLREMTAAARAMATGDYSRRVQATSRDEVGELARAFNTMAADLAAVDQQRRDLVANVSHELRTPVSALRAVLENLVDGVSPPDRQTLQAALGQTERLGRLVTDLLDLSRVDAGLTPLEIEELRLAPFLRSVLEEARVTDHPVEYRLDVRPADLAVPADRERLHQLLANLLDNAGRHSPEGGTVTVRARDESSGAGLGDVRKNGPENGPENGPSSGRVLLDVMDEGPGIAPSDRHQVFQRFTTGSGAAGDGGTGLGLAISRWVTDLHGGSIKVVDSTTGCHIRVALPLNRSSR